MDMVNEALGSYGNNLIIAVVGVGIALILLAAALWLIKRRGGSSPFIRGGRNRQPRLQVLDAAAVDARRRLVLVRRDNVEHLVMIGGPTDIVIESGIGAIPVLTPVDQRDNFLPDGRYEDERQQQVEPREAPHSISQPREVTHEQPAKAAPIVTPAPAPIVTPAPAAPAAATPAPVATPAPTPAPSATPTPAAQPAAIITPPPATASSPAAAPVVTPPPAPASVTAVRDSSVAKPAPVAPASTQTSAQVAPPAIEPVIESQRAARQEAPVVSAPVVAAPDVAAPIAPPVMEKPAVFVAAAPVVAPPDVVPPIKPAAVTQAVEPAPILHDARFNLDEISASDILESARNRVLPDRDPLRDEIKPAASTASAPTTSLSNDALSNDFEKFLEAEMAKTATGAPQPVTPAAANQQQQPERREPSAPPISGASTENEIQKEMARIFGEMSVTRDP